MTAIVIIDDHLPSRLSIARAARSPEIQFEVIGEYATAEEAFRNPELKQADVLIVDFAPPGELDGAGLIRRIRGQFAELTIIACGSFQGTASLDEAFAAGADRCLRKPLRKIDLLRTLLELEPACV